MLIKEIFGKAKIYKLNARVDNRGSLEYVFDENIDGFKVLEARIYSIPKKELSLEYTTGKRAAQ